jgi:hypothetical protein
LTKEYFVEELQAFVEELAAMVDDERIYSKLLIAITDAVFRSRPAVPMGRDAIRDRATLLQVAEQNGEFDINH